MAQLNGFTDMLTTIGTSLIKELPAIGKSVAQLQLEKSKLRSQVDIAKAQAGAQQAANGAYFPNTSPIQSTVSVNPTFLYLGLAAAAAAFLLMRKKDR